MILEQSSIGQFYIPPVLDLIALLLLAITGAVSAAKRGYDWVGTMAIALVTGCGGGLLRDILLNVRPVILEHAPYLWAIIFAVFLSTFLCRLLSEMRMAFMIADALGLTMYAVVGTQKALEAGLAPVAAVLIGTINGIGGGLVRDVITREEASLLKPGQWYASIALGASILFCLSQSLDVPIQSGLAGVLVVIVACAVRFVVQRYDIQTRPLKPFGFESSRW